MGKKSGPKPPDPYKMAEAQYTFGKRAREDSLTDATSAAGSSSYVKGPDGRFTLNQNLNPALQGRFDSVSGSMGDFDRGSMEQSLYDRSTALLRPELQNLRKDRLTQLNTQGLPIGGEAYTRALDQVDRSEYDTYQRAAMDATIQAGNEGRADRSMNLNELASLLSMTPNAEGNSALGAPDLMGAIQNNYAQKSANHNAKKQGLSQLAGTGLTAFALMNPATAPAAAATASDERLKTNIRKIGERFGFNWYTWTWNDLAEKIGLKGASEGVIAQEVERKRPDLVTMQDGYKAVRYALL